MTCNAGLLAAACALAHHDPAQSAHGIESHSLCSEQLLVYHPACRDSAAAAAGPQGLHLRGGGQLRGAEGARQHARRQGAVPSCPRDPLPHFRHYICCLLLCAITIMVERSTHRSAFVPHTQRRTRQASAACETLVTCQRLNIRIAQMPVGDSGPTFRNGTCPRSSHKFCIG